MNILISSNKSVYIVRQNFILWQFVPLFIT